jgi:Carboxypeptidase regulatory-like domain
MQDFLRGHYGQWTGKVVISRIFFRMIVLALTGCLFGATAVAQFRTSIQGVVTDPQGEVVPGATLTLTDTSTNQTVIRTSNGSGVFNFNALPADHFSLIIESKGFKKKILNDLQLIPEQPNALNVQLEIGGASETITVDASNVAALDTQTASIGGTITSNQIQNMPSFGRDVFQLIQLAPGVFGNGSQAGGGGTSNLPGNAGPGGSAAGAGIFQTENGPQSVANGGQTQTNSISIDGISTVSAVWGGTTVITPNEDSIDNVKIVSNGYDAENGRFSGAQIQVTSKSGTNSYHGSIFFRWNRPGLNAYQPYNGPGSLQPGTPAQRGLLRDSQRFNQIGGSVGGPIWKDRIFAFFAYETIRNSSSVTSTAWYETSAFDGLAPANSIASQFLTFPGAGVSAAGMINETCANIGLTENVNCRTIPGQGLNLGSPLTTPLGTQDLTWTGPNNPGIGSGLTNVADIANFTTVNPTSYTAVQYNGRLDGNITHRDHASFAIYWVPVSNTNFNGPIRAYNLFHHDQISNAFAGIWNHTFSPSFLNEARVNAAGWRWNEVTSNPQAPFGLPQAQIDQIGSIPSTGLITFGAPGPSTFNQWTYSYKDVATKVVSNHTLKFGGEVTRLYFLNEATYAARPSYNFYNIWAFLNDAPHTQAGTYDPLTGTPTAHRQDTRETIYGFFIQDDWKVRSNLTLNLGLRYSYFGPLSTKQGNLNSVEFSSGSDMFTGMSVRIGGNLWSAQKGNFGPQVGFAWSPDRFHARFVVRGGYGLNFNQEEIAVSSNAGNNPPSTVSPNFGSVSPSNINPNIVYAVASDPHSLFGYPPNPNTITTFNSVNLPTGGNVGVIAFPANMPTAYSHHYSLDTQYDLGHQLIATVGYYGSTARHIVTNSDAYVLAAAQGFALNPLVTNINYFSNGGTSNNNALRLGLKHSFSHQFMADAQFVWAKTMDDGSLPYFRDPYPYFPSYARGRSDYNVGKAFKLYGLWQPVFFRGSHGWLEKIVGGWSVSGIFNLHTGFPWTPVFNVPGGQLYFQGGGYSQLRPAAYLGGAGHDTSNGAFKSGPGVGNGQNRNFPQAGPNQPYFLKPQFTLAGSFPTTSPVPQSPGVARNSLTGPGYRDLDGTLSKAFGLPKMPVLGENAKFEIRADAFNLLNNLNFDPTSVTNDITLGNFGQAQRALGSRTVSLQARFSF